jgi:hypothetical protein
VFVVSNLAVLGQTASGSIAGVVKDQSGAVLPGVELTITNTGTGVKKSLISDEAGRYHMPALDPGMYDIEAQLPGFQTKVRQGIQLTVGRDLEIEMVLEPGQLSEKVVVTSEAPLVETVSHTLSGLVDEQTIRNLPLNGRSFDELMALQPGVLFYRIPASNISSGRTADQFSVAGNRALTNLFLLDGTEMVGAGYLSNLPGGVLGKQMGVDAIQEFSVLLGNYSAAYGKRNGGVVTLATRSGTNQFHGSAYEFLRNSALDARNFFDVTPQPPPFRRNQYGGTFGGPIRKDKTFFFVNYEGLREGLGLTNIATVPDNNARQGLLPCKVAAGFQCNASTGFANVGVAASVRPYIPVFFGEPNGRNFGDGTAEHIENPNQTSNQDYFLARVDHNISSRDTVFTRYNYTTASLSAPDQTSLNTTISDSAQHALTLEEKRSFSPTLLNDVRFGFSRAFLTTGGFPLVSVDPALRFVPNAPKLGSVTFSGGLDTGNKAVALTGTGIGNGDRVFALNQYEFTDQVYLYRGAHSLQFGFDFQRIQHNDNNASNVYGTFAYSGLISFLTAAPTAFVAGLGDASKSWRRLYVAGFVQDDYKIRPNLTLNLGLRYELMTVPIEVHNRISNFRLANGILNTKPVIGDPYFQSNKDLFAPRIGMVWDPFAHGKTVFRSGFGTFYDQLIHEWRQYGCCNPPFVSNLTVSNPIFPLGLSGPGTVPAPALGLIDFNSKIPTKLEWNFSIQQQLTQNGVLNVAYVGAHTYHLTRNFDPNTPIPQILPGGTAFYPAGSPERNPAFGPSEYIVTDASSSYEGLQTDYTQRLSRGLRGKVSYVFSKGIDDSSGPQVGYAPGEPSQTYNPYDRKADRGLSAYNTKHNTAINFTYDLPGAQLRGVTGKFFGGWQVGSIVMAYSGLPLTVQTGFRNTRNGERNLADRPSLRPGASNNPILGGPDHYFDPNAFVLPAPGTYGNLGRNTLIGPGFANVDFVLDKMTSIGERVKSEFRAEFFNVLNHPNFGFPSLAVFSSNGTVLGAAGRITSTANTSRQIQFGLKLSF